MRRIFVISLLCLCLYGKADERFERFVNLNTGNGKLTHNTVEAVARDSFGYLWVGTNYGLNRLDGYQTLNFIPDSTNVNSIRSGFIYTLLVDSKNNLWVGTIGGGLHKFNRETNGFLYVDPTDDLQISDWNITAIVEDRNGNIWYGTTGNYITKYIPSTGEFVKIDLEKSDPHKLPNSSVNTLFCDKEGNIWAGMTQGGVFMIDPMMNKILYFGLRKEHEGHLSVGSIKGIVQNTNGELLFVTWSGNLYKLNKNIDDHIKLKYNSSFFGKSYLTDIQIDNNEDIWVSTWGKGLYMIENKSGAIFHYQRHQYLANSLSSNTLNCLFIDHFNNLWIGALDNGLSMKPLSKKMFGFLPIMNAELNLPEEINAYAMVPSGQFLWIGTRGQGLIKYDLTNNSYKHYRVGNYPGMLSNHILNLKMGSDGTLWIGTDGRFVNSFDPVTEKFTQYEFKNNDWSRAVFCIAETEDHIWCGTWGGGIKKLDKKTKTYVTINFDEQDQFRNSIFDLKINDSILWIANIGMGLIRYDLKNDKWRVFSYSEENPDYPLGRILDIYFENNNSCWISTDGSGLYHFVPSMEKFERFSDRYNFNESIFQGVVNDSLGNIWLATNSGITHVDTRSGVNYNFDKNNGLINNQFNKSSLCYNPHNNTIYAGSVTGVNFTNPYSLIIDSTVNKVIITELSIMGQAIFNPNKRNLKVPVDIAEVVHLYRKDKVINIHFSSMEFNPSGKIEYLYTLEGFDQGWTSTSFIKNFVQYTNLDPDTYLFKIKASNNDGIFSDKVTTLRIIVHPAFWQTLLFKVFIALLIVFLIIFYFRNRYKKLIRDKAVLELKVQQRTEKIQKQKEQIENQNHQLELANDSKNKFFSIISHDLRNPVTSMEQLTELIITHYGLVSEEKLQNYFSLLKKTSSNTLELLDDLLVWARTQTNRIEINKTAVSVDMLIDSVYNLCKPLAEKKNIHLEFTSNTGYKVIADKNSISTVLRNLVTNAIKFTKSGGAITIGIIDKKGKILFSVTDTGVGMKDGEINELFKIEKIHSKPGTLGETGTGLGLIICQELLNLNGSKIVVQSELGKGSVFSFNLKKGNE
jgi:signal transduction histidine kinase/ligand-binding sensor domain-containing protein